MLVNACMHPSSQMDDAALHEVAEIRSACYHLETCEAERVMHIAMQYEHTYYVK